MNPQAVHSTRSTQNGRRFQIRAARKGDTNARFILRIAPSHITQLEALTILCHFDHLVFSSVPRPVVIALSENTIVSSPGRRPDAMGTQPLERTSAPSAMTHLTFAPCGKARDHCAGAPPISRQYWELSTRW